MLRTSGSKRSDETVTVTCRFDAELASGETVASGDATVDSGGVSVTSAQVVENNTAVSTRVSGGTNGTNGVITFTATTSSNQVLVRRVTVPVVSD